MPAWRDASGVEPTGQRSRYKLDDYTSYRANRLRFEYSELEMNLQSVVDNFVDAPFFDIGSGEQIVEILDGSRDELEGKDPNLDVVEDDLGRVRRLMIWVSPDAWVAAQAKVTQARLASSSDPEAAAFTFKDDATASDQRFRLDEAIGLDNRITAGLAGNSGLQVRRLTLFRNTGLVTVAALVLLAPVLLSPAALEHWALPLANPIGVIAALLTTAAIGTIGATGAILGGLMQARDTPVTFNDYKVRGMEIQLRILIGITVSVVLYDLLSWSVLPSVKVDNPGTFVLVAFLSGFSERYFLRLVGAETADAPQPRGPKMLNAPNASAGVASGDGSAAPQSG